MGDREDSEELTEKMRASLADVPGMVFGFSQPIQCRIDELVAGTRAQLIIKVSGDDLDVLTAKSAEIAAVLRRSTALPTWWSSGPPGSRISTSG